MIAPWPITPMPEVFGVIKFAQLGVRNFAKIQIFRIAQVLELGTLFTMFEDQIPHAKPVHTCFVRM
jgi:hypothetical protein